ARSGSTHDVLLRACPGVTPPSGASAGARVVPAGGLVATPLESKTWPSARNDAPAGCRGSVESGGTRSPTRSAATADVELAHAAAQCARVQSECAGRAEFTLDPPARALEDIPDVRALDVLERVAPRRHANRAGERRGERGRVRGRIRCIGDRHEQLAAVQRPAVRQDQRALDQVLELADVARPVAGACPFDESRRDAVEPATE